MLSFFLPDSSQYILSLEQRGKSVALLLTVLLWSFFNLWISIMPTSVWNHIWNHFSDLFLGSCLCNVYFNVLVFNQLQITKIPTLVPTPLVDENRFRQIVLSKFRAAALLLQSRAIKLREGRSKRYKIWKIRKPIIKRGIFEQSVFSSPMITRRVELRHGGDLREIKKSVARRETFGLSKWRTNSFGCGSERDSNAAFPDYWTTIKVL